MDGLFDKDAHLYIGNVVDVDDNNGGDRVRVAIYPADKRLPHSKIPYAFPLMPKFFHVKPKVGEMAIVLCEDTKPTSQRYYIGPIISQLQFTNYEGALNATTLLRGGVKTPSEPVDNKRETNGAFPKSDEIAILGRKNSDIIISDNDVRIRSGAKLFNDNKTGDVSFNKENPAFIKMKYYPKPLKVLDESVNSTATIVADKINLISTNGDPYFDVTDESESISDNEMSRIIESAHRLPYGDELVRFLLMFLEMFKSHTHKYHNMPPCPDGTSEKFDGTYAADEESLSNKLLSKDVRIN